MEQPASNPSFIRQHARTLTEVLVVIIVIISVAWWIKYHPRQVPVGIQVAAAPAKVIESTPQIKIVPKYIYVYIPAAKKELNLPQAEQDNKGSFVIGSSSIGSSDRPQTVTTVLDTDTGKTRTYVAQAPYPWLAAENNREVSLQYGWKSGLGMASNGMTWRAEFSDDLVQVKALHLGVHSTIDTDGQFYAGVSLSYKF